MLNYTPLALLRGRASMLLLTAIWSLSLYVTSPGYAQVTSAGLELVATVVPSVAPANQNANPNANQNANSDSKQPPKLVAAQKKLTLRVLSYNIHHAEGVDGRLDLERIAKIIQSVQPDIVALQEVDQKVARSESVDQTAMLSKLTGMTSRFGGNIDLQGGKYGNVILTRGEFIDYKNHALPNIESGEQRGLMDARLTIDGVTLRVMATHFDHRRDSRERLASIAKANEMAMAGGDIPTLLIGDLNAEFDSDVLTEARKLWTVSNATRMPTIPVGKPQRQIDFVLTYPSKRWSVKEVQVLDEQVASDHRAILAVLEL